MGFFVSIIIINVMFFLYLFKQSKTELADMLRDKSETCFINMCLCCNRSKLSNYDEEKKQREREIVAIDKCEKFKKCKG
jgi:hypothetical protein